MSLEDPLDSADYDPIKHLNGFFADSSSLARLSDIQQYVSLYESHLNYRLSIPQEISDDQRSRIDQALDMPQEMAGLKKELDSLRDKGRSTEEKIRGMTQGIKRLDNTKNNLIQSITVLKRLQMLTTAFSQLATQVKHHQYHEMVRTLPAVMELMDYFKPYRSIQQVAILSRQIGDLHHKIADQVLESFSSVIENKPPRSPNPAVRNSTADLADACLVLDSMPGDTKEKIITWYCTIQLREYKSIFKPSDEAGSLENTGRRYAYFKRLLKSHSDEMARYFAPQWNIAAQLCKAFCETTRDDMKVLLSKKDTDVQSLLSALAETLEFEQYLRKLNPACGQLAGSSASISSVFNQHLGIWIDHQDRILQSKFQQYKNASPLTNPDSTDDEDSPSVLPSSADLFVVYRQMLAQLARLSKGKILLDLQHLFKKWLAIYSYQVLRAFLPDKTASHIQLKTVCIILNTADYCSTTIGQLETKMIDTISNEFKEQISFEDNKEKFLEITNTCISLLANHFDKACDHAWRIMMNTNWSKVQTVGDQSSYVTDIRNAIDKTTNEIMGKLTKDVHKRLVCDRAVEKVIHSFFMTIVRCRPITEVAAEQMLLDLYVMKEIFFQMENTSNKQQSSSFARHVTATLNPLETILKVALTQADPEETLVQNYFILVGDKSSENFTKILELKGIVSRAVQNRFLEVFKMHMRAYENLKDASPMLTSLNLSAFRETPESSRVSSVTEAYSPYLPSSRTPSNNIKEGLEKGFEKFTHDASNIKLNENFRNIGRLFRRDGRNSPFQNNNNHN